MFDVVREQSNMKTLFSYRSNRCIQHKTKVRREKKAGKENTKPDSKVLIRAKRPKGSVPSGYEVRFIINYKISNYTQQPCD